MTSPQTSSCSPSSKLPLKEIPGGFGLPILGPIKDRWDYFYNQGQEPFFKSRMLKYNSTVYRSNMPRGYFMGLNPKVVVLLDSVSLRVLHDLSKVEKKDNVGGSYLPSLSFTGGYRPCLYLDPSEPNHAKLKGLFFSILSSRHSQFIPQFQSFSSLLLENLDDQVIKKNSEANFNTLSDNMNFNFLFQLLFDNNKPTEPKKIMTKWMLLQLAPWLTLGLPKIFNLAEDLALHTFRLPWFLVKSDYKKVYDVVYSSSTGILDEAEKMGLKRDEACHNLIFMLGLNAYAGLKTAFPSLVKWVGLAGEKLHMQLAEEIRSTIKSEGGQVSLSVIDKMKLTKSVVFEALRIEPPVAFQYGTAKKDFIIESHDSAFEIKKGEMILGYQPLATKDPKIFENPEEFVGYRFVGEEGEKMLKFVYWANGPQPDATMVNNKICPGKDVAVLLLRLFLVEFFMRYDTFTVRVKTPSAGPSVVTVTSLKKKKA